MIYRKGLGQPLSPHALHNRNGDLEQVGGSPWFGLLISQHQYKVLPGYTPKLQKKYARLDAHNYELKTCGATFTLRPKCLKEHKLDPVADALMSHTTAPTIERPCTGQVIR
jgi:hypothetical protein